MEVGMSDQHQDLARLAEIGRKCAERVLSRASSSDLRARAARLQDRFAELKSLAEEGRQSAEGIRRDIVRLATELDHLRKDLPPFNPHAAFRRLERMMPGIREF